jgi:hypothetical protein
MTQTIRTGDRVMWRGCFNTQPAMPVEVTGIELCSVPRSKYGNPINEVPVDKKDYCVFSLSNGHWAYGEQISPAESLECAQICDSQEVEEYEMYYV